MWERCSAAASRGGGAGRGGCDDQRGTAGGQRRPQDPRGDARPAAAGRVFKQALRSRDPLFTVLCRCNNSDLARLGLAISKKHCRRAVGRNRIKRIVRESFRQHQDFHEACVERMFVDILARCRPQALSVCARYTRRGGIDINPYRSSGEERPANTRLWRQ